ncbi:MAG: IS21 family transposase, partial [Candidatus Limnocylindria bacterium]
MKRSVEVMEILEAFDLTGSYRAAAALTGSDHKTVARYVRERDRGRAAGEAAQRRKRIDPLLAKLE